MKAPEKEAFEKYLPKDVQIVSLHSLHGPGVSPEGQPLVSVFFASSFSCSCDFLVIDSDQASRTGFSTQAGREDHVSSEVSLCAHDV